MTGFFDIGDRFRLSERFFGAARSALGRLRARPAAEPKTARGKDTP